MTTPARDHALQASMLLDELDDLDDQDDRQWTVEVAAAHALTALALAQTEGGK